MNNQRPWYYSWGVIILAFLFFWPVGIVLLVMRNRNTNKVSRQSLFTNTNKKKYITIGVILIVIGLTTISDSALMGLFLIIGGIILIIYSEKLVKDAARRKKYMDLIVNNQVYSLEKIASICNVQYSVVLKELNQLISFGVLKGAYIDEGKRQVMIAGTPNTSGIIPMTQTLEDGLASFTQTVTGAAAVQQPKMVAAVCPGCGAKMSIPEGAVVECEYCAATVSAQ